jgi:hypothetical protein
MAEDRGKPGFGEDESGAMLRRILSPAEAQSLVLPPPDHPPVSGPGESTPLTGNLTAPPFQAVPSRQGLAAYFASAPAQVAGRSGDSQYVKVSSHGQVGYLPRANLLAAKQIDQNLKVLMED